LSSGDGPADRTEGFTMQWRDVKRRPDVKVLRQFGGLCLAIGAGIVAWQFWRGNVDWRSYVAGALALAGVIGLARPLAIRWFYTGWMAAVFPIGWTISKVIIAFMFFGLFTPVAMCFRAIGRDALRRRKPQAHSLWVPRRQAERASGYLRQY
jgi:hypothetical protein